MAGVLFLTFISYYFITYSFRKHKYKWGLLSLILTFITYQYFTYYAFYLLEHYGGTSGRTSAILLEMGELSFLEIPFSTHVFYHSFTLSLFYLILPLSLKIAFELAKSVYNNQKLEAEKLRLELNYLRSQVNPHFLFNMLNSLYKVSLGNEKATNILLNLQKFLEYSLINDSSPYILLSRELEFLTSYVALEKLRLDSHKKLSLNVTGSAGNLQIAPLILVNFIENAIKHGLNNTNQPSWVEIEINIINQTLYFSCRNQVNFLGKNTISENEKGIGINNARRQLEVHYPKQHDYLQDISNNIYKVIIQVQLRA